LFSGCTKKTGNLVKQADSPVNVVEKYINLLPSYDSIESIKNQLPYVNGYLYKYSIERRIYFVELKNITEEFSSKFYDDCYDVYKKDFCDQTKDIINEPFEILNNVSLLHIEEVNRTKNSAEVKAKLEEIGSKGRKVVEVLHYLENVDGEWKIYDLYTESDGLLSAASIEEVKKSNLKTLDKAKDFLNSQLEKMKKLKNDKCSQIDTLDLDATEIESQKNICYTGKYIDYVKKTKNETVCNEISDPHYLGACYSQIASVLGEPNICENVENIKYGAKGYYGNVSSRDMCYFYYNQATYGEKETGVCSHIENQQQRENCYEMYN